MGRKSFTGVVFILYLWTFYGTISSEKNVDQGDGSAYVDNGDQAGTAPNNDLVFYHHDYEEMVGFMKKVHEICPEITRLYNLSEPSVQGRNLTVMEITRNPGVHMPGKPEFKYVGNMHGNEVVGKEMLLYLMLEMCEEYRRGNKLVNFIINETRVHILPSMNPDGWQIAADDLKKNGKSDWMTGRQNAHNVDLNRNFPELNAKMYENERKHKGRNNHLLRPDKAMLSDDSLEPETRAVMKWLSEIGFVLSANLHGGDLVANYPYDETRSGKPHEYTACPDDHTFVYLAKSYAEFHRTMNDSNRPPCDAGGDSKSITNGGEWYSVPRGMQDYNYLNTNCFEITLELGCEKFPPASQLEQLWNDNAGALINYMLQSHIGVKGFVKTVSGEPVANASIKVVNLASGLPILHDILSLEQGDYYRLLGDGYYHISAELPGYYPDGVCIHVRNHINIERTMQELQPAPQLNFTLIPKAEDTPKNQREFDTCEELWNEVQEETKIEDRDLLVSVLSFLEPIYKWSAYANRLTTLQLYYFLAQELKRLNAQQMREILIQLPRAVQEQLELVILASMNEKEKINL